jgi:hypothetical protein
MFVYNPPSGAANIATRIIKSAKLLENKYAKTAPAKIDSAKIDSGEHRLCFALVAALTTSILISSVAPAARH